MQRDVDLPWRGLSPDEVASELAKAAGAWWMCGGWAIDLWAGRQTRSHADTDVGCFRADLPELRRALEEWELFEAVKGELMLLRGRTAPDPEVHNLWCRRRGAGHWGLQIMIEARSGDDWVYRRDHRIRIPVSKLTWINEDGLAVLRPEVQLLYKAKDVRTRDQEDFELLRGMLNRDATQWLAANLALIHPGHPWLSQLMR